MTDSSPSFCEYSSPVCLAGEILPEYLEPLNSDPARIDKIYCWRKATRTRLLAGRKEVNAKLRREADIQIAAHLDQVLTERFNGAANFVVAGFWPINAEPDLREWMGALSGHGVTLALPVVVSRHSPLIFRPWSPDSPMRAGQWNIAEPATDNQIIPQIILAPLVGWDEARYRMGYGGGFYDRTLAAMTPRPFTIGIGLEAGRLQSIHPQQHDISLSMIITEDRII